MANLLSLPADIKTLITAYITRPSDRRALFMTCKELYASVIPLVYKHLKVGKAITPQRMVRALAASNEGVRWIRHVTLCAFKPIRHYHEEDHTYKDDHTEVHLALLAYMLPRDILLTFA